MSRIRWIASFGAATLGVASIAAGVHWSRPDQPSVALRAAGSSADTDVTELPRLDVPVAETTTTTVAVTETTTSTIAAPVVTTTTMSPPTSAVPVPTTVLPPAQVIATNESNQSVKVYVGDDSEHAKVLAPGEGVSWLVTAGTGHPDSGGAVEPTTGCGTKWNDEDILQAGHRYRMTIRSSGASTCPSGKAWPTMHFYDETDGYGWFRGGPSDLPRSG